MGVCRESWQTPILCIYRKFLKSSEIVYNRLEIKNVTGQTTLCHAMFEEGDTLLAVIQKSFFYNKIKVASNSNKGAKKWTQKNRHRSLHYKR